MAKQKVVNPKRRTTLRDVADYVGCSTAVVSTVINGSRGRSMASEQLSQRITQAAQKLGYRPDFVSQSMARRSTRTLGVYVEKGEGTSISYPYESTIICGVEQACQQHEYDLLIISLSGKAAPQVCLNKMIERRVDGLILLHVLHDATWIDSLLARQDHVVTVNYYGPAPLLSVNFDNKAATAMAVRHLYELGHRRIGYVGSLMMWGPGEQLRSDGYHEAMAQLNLPIDPLWVVDDRTAPPTGMASEHEYDAVAHHMIQLGNARPTAIVCGSDWAAIGLTRYFRRHGLEVPGDMSVIGHDDKQICRYFDPPMSSIHQPLEAMGRKAAELLNVDKEES